MCGFWSAEGCAHNTEMELLSSEPKFTLWVSPSGYFEGFCGCDLYWRSCLSSGFTSSSAQEISLVFQSEVTPGRAHRTICSARHQTMLCCIKVSSLFPCTGSCSLVFVLLPWMFQYPPNFGFKTLISTLGHNSILLLWYDISCTVFLSSIWMFLFLFLSSALAKICTLPALCFFSQFPLIFPDRLFLCHRFTEKHSLLCLDSHNIHYSSYSILLSCSHHINKVFKKSWWF